MIMTLGRPLLEERVSSIHRHPPQPPSNLHVLLLVEVQVVLVVHTPACRHVWQTCGTALMAKGLIHALSVVFSWEKSIGTQI